jgi:hypothetical protein
MDGYVMGMFWFDLPFVQHVGSFIIIGVASGRQYGVMFRLSFLDVCDYHQ